MYRIVAMMLMIGVPSIAMDASSPLAEAKGTGELTVGEKLFQGVWQLHTDGSAFPPGTLHIEGREFRADVIHGQYTGYVTIRSDTFPARIDFTIENCDCKFDGLTSKGIYYEDEGSIVFVAPAPGEPRPTAFTGLDETKVMIQRATRAEGPVLSRHPGVAN